MRIAITGKEGVGKTTSSAYLSRIYAENGFHTLPQTLIQVRDERHNHGEGNNGWWTDKDESVCH